MPLSKALSPSPQPPSAVNSKAILSSCVDRMSLPAIVIRSHNVCKWLAASTQVSDAGIMKCVFRNNYARSGCCPADDDTLWCASLSSAIQSLACYLGRNDPPKNSADRPPYDIITLHVYAEYISPLTRRVSKKTKGVRMIQEWLANPAVQAGVAPFITAFLSAALLRRIGWYWAGVAVVAGFAVAVYLSTGFQFQPWTGTRKIIALILGAAAIGLLFDLYPYERRWLLPVTFVAAAAAVLWVMWPVLTRRTGMEFWLLAHNNNAYTGWCAAAMERLRAKPEAMMGAAVAFGFGAGGAWRWRYCRCSLRWCRPAPRRGSPCSRRGPRLCDVFFLTQLTEVCNEKEFRRVGVGRHAFVRICGTRVLHHRSAPHLPQLHHRSPGLLHHARPFRQDHGQTHGRS